jgi:membrane protein YdbS with pleckstrin-like domain
MTINLAALILSAVGKDVAMLWGAITSNPWVFSMVIVFVVLAVVAKAIRPVSRRQRPRSAYRR